MSLSAVSLRSDSSIPVGGVASLQRTVDFEQYRLANGMEVILHHDAKAPLVHVLLWYHVGSKNERADRTGFAHLFEHMMFQGSENVGKAEHFTHIQGIGGTMNASTGQDRTDYFQTVPRQHLGLALWLEADRMRSLQVTQENYDNQRAVVSEERSQRYDNAPYGLWLLEMFEMLYGGSSYAWGPIGDMGHLRDAGLEEVQAFHRTWYAPNNATLVVAGDFDRAELTKLIETYFADIPAVPEPERSLIPVTPLTSTVRREIRDAVPFPSVYIGMQGPAIQSEDVPALAVAMRILGAGRSSRLYRSLVYGQQIAQDAGAVYFPMEFTGCILMIATAAPEVDAETIEKGLMEQVAKLRENGVTEQEVTAARNALIARGVRSMARMENVADALAEGHVLRGDAGALNRSISDVQRISVADVHRVIERYLDPERAAILHYVPTEVGA